MATVYLICGKLCCGKSTYAKKLKRNHKAVVLSVDEIMLAVFGLYAGEKHDEYAANVRTYLFEKSLELIQTGVSVILDWGFWTKAARYEAKAFYRSRNIECELYYLDISDEVWQARINQRNRSIMAGERRLISLTALLPQNLKRNLSRLPKKKWTYGSVVDNFPFIALSGSVEPCDGHGSFFAVFSTG